MVLLPASAMGSKLYGLDKQARYAAAASSLSRDSFVLDLGGGWGDFLEFCGCRGVVADLPPTISLLGRAASVHGFVAVKGPLPFRDRSFDAVVCIDTLEHIPARDRAPLVREMLRVSRSQVIVVFPEKQFFLPVLQAIAGFYARTHLGPAMEKSLLEHLHYGLPTHEEVVATADSQSWSWTRKHFFGRVSTLVWICQLAMPFLATQPFNRAFSSMIGRVPEQEGGECLVAFTKT